MATPDGQNLRQVAAEARLSVPKARERLQKADIPVPYQGRALTGRQLRRVRRALGLAAEPGAAPPKRLSQEEIDARILRPLLRKRKVGRTRTSPIENAYGHGIPDDQKADAKERVAELLRNGILLEKPSQGRRHVYLSPKGRELAAKLREQMGDDGDQ